MDGDDRAQSDAQITEVHDLLVPIEVRGVEDARGRRAGAFDAMNPRTARRQPGHRCHGPHVAIVPTSTARHFGRADESVRSRSCDAPTEITAGSAGYARSQKEASVSDGAAAPSSRKGGLSVTLGQLLELVGPDFAEMLVAPNGLDVEVAGLAIHDPLAPPPLGPGDLLLAVGSDPKSLDTRGLLDEAAGAGVTAVVMKLHDHEPGELVADARVALIAVPDELTWAELHTLLRAAMSSVVPPAEHASLATPLGDLFALANAIATMVGGPVTIEDPHFAVLAYSSLDEPIDEPRRETILGRHSPDAWAKRLRERGVLRTLWTTDAVVRYEDPEIPGFAPRLAVAVRAGDEILGTIWVAEGRRPLGGDAERALERAGRAAALHLVRHRADEDLARRRRSEHLRAILEGRGPVDELAARLDLDPASAFVVAAFALDAESEEELEARRDHALNLVMLHCETFRRHAACVAVGSVIYALLPDSPAATPAMLRSVSSEAADRVEDSLRLRVRAAIGPRVGDLGQVRRSRRQADQVLRVLAAGAGRVAHVDDVRNETLLLELGDLAGERPHLLDGKVTRLVERDAARGTPYVETLRAYLDAFGDVALAADCVGVHPNTFRYRLRRLAEVSGLDLDDPDERLVVQLQLRLMEGGGTA
jgi:sugar diacid utilization regulator